MFRKRLLVCLGMFAAVASAYLPIANNTVFELEGNADDDAGLAGLDWKSLNPPGASADPKATFVHDLSTPARIIYSPGAAPRTPT